VVVQQVAAREDYFAAAFGLGGAVLALGAVAAMLLGPFASPPAAATKGATTVAGPGPTMAEGVDGSAAAVAVSAAIARIPQGASAAVGPRDGAVVVRNPLAAADCPSLEAAETTPSEEVKEGEAASCTAAAAQATVGVHRHVSELACGPSDSEGAGWCGPGENAGRRLQTVQDWR